MVIEQRSMVSPRDSEVAVQPFMKNGSRVPEGATAASTSAMRVAILVATLLAPAHRVAAQTVRDSAGVTIVVNAKPLWTAAQTWRLSSAPMVRAELESGPACGTGGECPAPGVTSFTQLSDGRILVANGGTESIAIYDATGRKVQSVGRPGDGPGEFGQISRMCRIAGDTVAVEDGRTLKIFAPNGTFVRNVQYTLPVGVTRSWTQACLANGRFFVGNTGTSFSGRATTARDDSTWLLTMPVVLYDRTGQVNRVIGDLPAYRETAKSGRVAVNRFGASLVTATDGRRYFYGFPESEYAVRVYSAEGQLERIIRRQWSPVPITASEIQALTAQPPGARPSAPSTMPDREPQARQMLAPLIVYAKAFPAFLRALADPAGNLWVQEWAREAQVPKPNARTATKWSVFDPQGRWQGIVDMPAGFIAAEIGVDYVLGSAKDADDVPFAVMYRIEKPR